MSVIEITTFRLAAGVDEATFLSADARVQNEFAHLQPGIQRRTTARGPDGEWAVVVLWWSAPEAEAAARAAEHHPAVQELMSFVDADTHRVSRYETLD